MIGALRVNLRLMSSTPMFSPICTSEPATFVQRLHNVFQTSMAFETRWVVVVQTSLVHWERMKPILNESALKERSPIKKVKVKVSHILIAVGAMGVRVPLYLGHS